MGDAETHGQFHRNTRVSTFKIRWGILRTRSKIASLQSLILEVLGRSLDGSRMSYELLGLSVDASRIPDILRNIFDKSLIW